MGIDIFLKGKFNCYSIPKIKQGLLDMKVVSAAIGLSEAYNTNLPTNVCGHFY